MPELSPGARPARVEVTPRGPYMVTGGPPLTRRRAPGEPPAETLRTNDPYVLCRCGGSSRKPFCDGTHRRNGFDSTGFGAEPEPEPETGTGTGTEPGIAVIDDGPLALTGVTLRRPDGSSLVCPRVRLCRCGASANKPFCDDSHESIGFRDPS